MNKNKHRFMVRVLCNACKTYHYKTYVLNSVDECAIAVQKEFPSCIKCNATSMTYTLFCAIVQREIVT